MTTMDTYIGSNNSVVEFYSILFIRLHTDVASRYPCRIKALNCERNKILSRIREEGLSFLTKTLPRFGKAVDLALSTDTPLSMEGLQSSPMQQLPKLFGWLLERVFDPTSGLPWLVDPCTFQYVKRPASPWTDRETCEALMHFRGLVYLLYKLKTDYDTQTTTKVIKGFVDTDESLKDHMGGLSDDVIISTSRRMAADIFNDFDEMDIIPTHGPGSVATGEDVVEKTAFKRVYSTIEQKYPFMEYFVYSPNHAADDSLAIASLENLEAGTAKVVLVPKDSRGPRLISCEPLEIQWIQQGLGRKVMTHLESHPLTRGHVNFTDQTINRDLAKLGSLDPSSWVTLDMKDASDRVSLDLVSEIFRDSPGLLAALIATRSTQTRLPSGTVVALNKFAPMGSCLCFPIEAFVFYALAVSAIMYNYDVTCRKARQLVYVYGDDIIVHRKVYPAVLQHLPRFKLMFNASKCCVAGFFRESCGCDAYKGVDVTPTRLRATWSPRRANSPETLYSYVAFSNAMYNKGYVGVAHYIRTELESIYGKLPYTDHYESSTLLYDEHSLAPSGVAFYANHTSLRELNKGIRTRFNRDLYILEYMSYIAKPKKVEPMYDNYAELLRRRNGGLRDDRPIRSTSESPEETLLELYAVRHRSRLKRRWIRLT